MREGMEGGVYEGGEGMRMRKYRMGGLIIPDLVLPLAVTVTGKRFIYSMTSV